MINVAGLTKTFGSTRAVDDLSFVARPGAVTGFLGPNGSGKSTSMRCMLGLDRPDHGETTFQGQRFNTFAKPLHEVGALLDAGYVHPGRSGRNHLRWLAASNGIGVKRVDEVLSLVGLTSAASWRVRAYSLGMRQRLGLAGVLLGDPHTVILDEPANGLDPEGIRWIRDVLTHLAGQGRTIFVSSHLLSEMALMATDLVVIGQGRLIEQCTVAEFVARWGDHWVRVRSPRAGDLARLLAAGGAHVATSGDATLEVRGASIADVGELAAREGVALHELSPQTGSLEDAFLKATASVQEYRSVPAPPPAGGPA
ncbi:MAG: ATP-binding cassette domain-containing protein [Ilumatobacteraceae bacterium]